MGCMVAIPTRHWFFNPDLHGRKQEQRKHMPDRQRARLGGLSPGRLSPESRPDPSEALDVVLHGAALFMRRPAVHIGLACEREPHLRGVRLLEEALLLADRGGGLSSCRQALSSGPN